MGNPITAVELWLYDHLPVVFADGVSSALHGLAVFVPTLLFGAIAAPLGTTAGAVVATLYWVREDADSVKAKRNESGHKRSEKLRDSMRDRLFPVGLFIVANLMLYL